MVVSIQLDDFQLKLFISLLIDCKNLAPEWARAATELKGKVKLGVVDATVHTQSAQRYGVQGFPTIKFFPAGKKNGQAEDYNGGRTASVRSHLTFLT